jgi:shikimate 5-dehydrogenase
MAFKAKTNSNKHKSHTVQEAIHEAIKSEMVGLNIKMPIKKRATFKAKSAINNESMQDVILRAIDSYIQK